MFYYGNRKTRARTSKKRARACFIAYTRVFKWAPLLYEHLSVTVCQSHLCVSVSPPVRFCVPPPFAFIIYNPTMELGGVLVPTYRNRVVIFSSNI